MRASFLIVQSLADSIRFEGCSGSKAPVILSVLNLEDDAER